MDWIRRASEHERDIADGLYAACLASTLGREQSAEAYWYNVWSDGKYNISVKDVNGLQAFLEILTAELFPEWSCRSLVSVSIIVSPVGMRTTQPWHLDYTGTEGHCLIPMTPFTTGNATQFVRGQWTGPVLEHLKTVTGVPLLEEVLQRSDREFVEMSQVICPSYSVLRMVPGTLHRGIANMESFDRVMLCIVVNTSPIVIAESAVSSFMSR